MVCDTQFPVGWFIFGVFVVASPYIFIMLYVAIKTMKEKRSDLNGKTNSISL